jgi:hypothetical protein
MTQPYPKNAVACYPHFPCIGSFTAFAKAMGRQWSKQHDQSRNGYVCSSIDALNRAHGIYPNATMMVSLYPTNPQIVAIPELKNILPIKDRAVWNDCFFPNDNSIEDSPKDGIPNDCLTTDDNVDPIVNCSRKNPIYGVNDILTDLISSANMDGIVNRILNPETTMMPNTSHAHKSKQPSTENTTQKRDHCEDIPKTNPIFRADNLLNTEDEIEDVANRILNPEITATMPSARHSHNGKQSSMENMMEKNDDGRIDNEFHHHQQAEHQLLPPGKVYQVVRRLLKRDTQIIHKLERTVRKPEQDSSTFSGGKIKQNPPRTIACADIQSTPSRSNGNTKPNVETNKVNKPAATTNRTIFTYKTWNGMQNRWNRTKTYTVGSNTSSTPPHHFCIPLSRGGELNIFPNLINVKKVNRVKKELLESKFWRKYSIQGGDEPRLHFLVRFVV